MLSDLYIRIYILPLPGLFSVCVFCLICFLLLAHHCGARWWWRPLLGGMLLLWAAIVLYATALGRTGGLESSLAAIPFHSYREVLSGGNPEILRSNLMNVVLFLPAGVLSASMLPADLSRLRRLLTTSLTLCLFSLGIEAAQYLGAMGLAEIDDVIHNTLGTVIGCMTVLPPHKR